MATISKADPKDIKELNLLINSAYRGESAKKGWTHEADILSGIRINEQELQSLISKKNTSLLKYSENGNITACVLLEQQEDALYLGMLTVSPVLQGKGVGKTLLNYAEEYARNMKCSKIKMTVISVRKELIEWYIRRGYADTGQRIPFPGEGRFGIPNGPLEFIVLIKNIA
ncbi:MAG: GNAT family N-acetyltransferase [Bacteroidota bacterium]|nr:GNAT family N-acetyltransferase [Bacteroidota bacterium]